jgi:adenosylhomocysteinase
MHLGKEAEKDLSVLDNPDSEEAEVMFAAIKDRLKTDPTWYTDHSKDIKV